MKPTEIKLNWYVVFRVGGDFEHPGRVDIVAAFADQRDAVEYCNSQNDYSQSAGFEVWHTNDFELN